MRGDVGIDGQATEEKRDEAELERDKAREQLLRGRTYLGRELLTWLLWKSDAGDPVAEVDGVGIVPLFTGRLTLRGIIGEVNEMMVRGAMSPYSEQVRHALARGLLVHQARVRLAEGERVFEATLDAEFLDIRAAKLPELLAEEEDDRATERLDLAEHLSRLVDALVEAFLAVRTSKAWAKKTVPELKAWMAGEDGTSERTTLERARAPSGGR